MDATSTLPQLVLVSLLIEWKDNGAPLYRLYSGASLAEARAAAERAFDRYAEVARAATDAGLCTMVPESATIAHHDAPGLSGYTVARYVFASGEWGDA